MQCSRYLRWAPARAGLFWVCPKSPEGSRDYRHLAIPDRVADCAAYLFLVAIKHGAIDVPVPKTIRLPHCRIDLARLRFPRAQAQIVAVNGTLNWLRFSYESG
jgi:hypothetical protein